MKIEKDSDLVVRHNSLINANIRLDAKEYDLIRTFMKYIKQKDSDFWTFTVLADEIGINKARGKPMVKSIQRKPIEIDLPSDGIVSIPFFSYLKYQNGVFEGKFNTSLKDVLLQVSGDFTKTFEKYILPMDSVYAKRIYELLYENKEIGYRKFKLEDLYETLQVPKSMRNYANFKKYVLVIVIKEINKHSDIYIPVNTKDLNDNSWVALQYGKKRGVTHLNFVFREKDDLGLFAEQQQEESEDNKSPLISVRKELKEHIDIMIYQIADTNAEQQKYEQYYDERLDEFLEWVERADFTPPNGDWIKSFNRHCEGYKKNMSKLDTKI